MSQQRLRRGMNILWNGFEFQIEERLSKRRVRLLNKTTNERRLVDETELVEASFNGSLEILGITQEYENLQKIIDFNRVSDFSALDDTDPRKLKAIRRYKYVKRLVSAAKTGFTNQYTEAVIGEIAAEINDCAPPSARMVCRWLKRFVEAGEDVRALVDAEKSKGNRKNKLSPDEVQNQILLQIISDSIKEIYLTIQQNTKQAVYDLIVYRINKFNECRAGSDKLPIPSYKSIWLKISKLDQYEVDRARKGERYAQIKHKTHKKHAQPTRPLERVECDDTRTDLMVIDRETSLPLGRPWLTVLIDVYSKMILGYYLSFDPPSYMTVMMALKHSIKPKSYLKDKYPEFANSWDTYGLIETLVVDNARHLHSKSLEDACYQMGTDLQFAPVQVPWYKGSVERFLRTVHSDFIHKQPGTTFSNIFDKGEYDPEKHAVIHLDLLEELLEKWIVDVYSQSIHKGINAIPARRWKNSIVEYPPALLPPHIDLDIILGKIAHRKISGTVIHFQNLEYSDSVLATIRANQDGSEKIKIKYDPTDLGMIYVYDAFWCKYVPVPAVDQEYAKGLSEWQHELICKFVRRTNENQVDKKALAEAKEYIRQRVLQALAERPKKIKASSRIARWITSENPAEVSLSYSPESTRNIAQLPENSVLTISDCISNEEVTWSEDEKWNSFYFELEEEDKSE